MALTLYHCVASYPIGGCESDQLLGDSFCCQTGFVGPHSSRIQTVKATQLLPMNDGYAQRTLAYIHTYTHTMHSVHNKTSCNIELVPSVLVVKVFGAILV
jgi:hypothetical protein